ncbi:MAG TPA: hypothetical protein VFO55_11625 [Gemmatimonadaceae bacterium]|nr:hypothetical protein [Gemmatimonadaceae bacterium]
MLTTSRLHTMIFTRVVSDRLFERAGAKKLRRVWHRPGALPALALPFENRRRRAAMAVSALLHLIVVWALLLPSALTNLRPDLELAEIGGGGPGPAGGGGGGTRGTGGVKYVAVTPPPQEVAVTPPVVPPVEAVVQPPKPVVPEPVVPQVEIPKVATTEPKPEVKVQSPIIGTGGGTGNDGTAGNGPGRGGGVGSGIGTGRGSGVGPGTGGGNLDSYPPTITEMPLMPLPTPSKVKGTTVKANFYIAASGAIDSVVFTPTRDGGYNRKLNDLFKTFKFRPATTLDGVPIKGVYPFSYDF